MKNTNQAEGRRAFLKKAAYAAPVILTLKAQASYAGCGSENGDQDGDCQGEDEQN